MRSLLNCLDGCRAVKDDDQKEWMKTSSHHSMVHKTRDDPHLRSYSLNDFYVTQRIGRGKYGRVYCARDKTRNETVALKVSLLNGIFCEC